MYLDLTKRIAARFLGDRGSSRFACIIAVGRWDGKQSLLKNRDRNYEPKVRIIRDLLDGVEVCYMTDEVTGWCEGLNEFGIGVVNSALAVGRDEAEKKLVSKGKKSKDGERILKALSFKTLKDAIESARTYHGGIKGHTFISDPENAAALEQTSKHECHVTDLKPGVVQVRTNHGIEYEDAGYTEGEKYISSVLRRQQALKALKKIEDPYEAATTLMDGRKKDRNDPNNMVRDTEEMSTTSQMVLDLTDLKLQFFEIPGKSEYLGMENRLPKGRKPKIEVEVFRYSKDGEEVSPIDPESLKEIGSTSKKSRDRFAPYRYARTEMDLRGNRTSKVADNFPDVIEDARQGLPDPSDVLERYLDDSSAAKCATRVANRFADSFREKEAKDFLPWAGIAELERERLSRKAVKLKGAYLNLREVVDIMEGAPERSGNDLLFAADLLSKVSVEVNSYLHALNLLLGIKKT